MKYASTRIEDGRRNVHVSHVHRFTSEDGSLVRCAVVGAVSVSRIAKVISEGNEG